MFMKINAKYDEDYDNIEYVIVLDLERDYKECGNEMQATLL